MTIGQSNSVEVFMEAVRNESEVPGIENPFYPKMYYNIANNIFPCLFYK